MFKRILTLASIMAVGTVGFAQTGTATGAQATAAKPEVAKSKTLTALQGAWLFTTVNGNDTAGQPEVVLTITDNKYVQTAGGEFLESGTFKIDETKKPMALEITVVEGKDAGKVQFGVFELTGTAMKCKVNDTGVATKPTDFSIAEGSFVFTAVKKK